MIGSNGLDSRTCRRALGVGTLSSWLLLTIGCSSAKDCSPLKARLDERGPVAAVVETGPCAGNREALRRGADYLGFAAHAPQSLAPLGDEELDQRLSAVDRLPVPIPQGLEREDLRRHILRALGIDSLTPGLDPRHLTVSVLTESQESGIFRRKLLFNDPRVGSFEATLLVPQQRLGGAVLGLHGHRDDDHAFARRYLGESLAKRGFVVLMPSYRFFDCSRREALVARVLLRERSSLLGVYVYESLLMLKYLRQMSEVGDDPVALLGHSGGSVIASLLARVSDEFAVLVIDHSTDFRNRCGLRRNIHCQTVPDLFPLAADIDNRSTLAIPSLRVPYGFQEKKVQEQVLTFLVSQTRPTEDRQAQDER